MSGFRQRRIVTPDGGIWLLLEQQETKIYYETGGQSTFWTVVGSSYIGQTNEKK